MNTPTRFLQRFGWKRPLFIALSCMIVAVVAMAADLGAAKAGGYVGEKPDGYLGLVRDDAPGDIRELVNEVNAKRQAEYRRIAEQQGAPLSEVEKVGGMTAIEKTRSGHYVMDASGRWRRK